MRLKWNPEEIKRKYIDTDDEVYKQRLEELSELFYDAFCELHKSVSVEPKNTKFCDEQNLEKVG